jgi:hypothetical protein
MITVCFLFQSTTPSIGTSPIESPHPRDANHDLPDIDEQLRKVELSAPVEHSGTPKASAPRPRSVPATMSSVKPANQTTPTPPLSSADGGKSPGRSPSYPFPVVSPRKNRPPQLRKSSTSSTLAPSIVSSTSVHAPSTPGLRRAPTPLAPRLDLTSCKGEIDSTSPPRVREMRPAPGSAPNPSEHAFPHKRGESVATTTAGADAKERLREFTSAPASGGGKRQRTVSEMGNAIDTRRRTSGYFSSWRRAVGENTVSESPTSSANNAPKQKTQPLISKFCSPFNFPMGSHSPPTKLEPPVPTMSSVVSPPSTATNAEPPRRTISNVSLSRTQQKLLLQRDAPLAPEPTSLLYPSASSPAPASALNTPALRQTAQANLQRWAQAIVREAERIDKEHATVRRFRNPVEESWRRLAECVLLAFLVVRGVLTLLTIHIISRANKIGRPPSRAVVSR